MNSLVEKRRSDVQALCRQHDVRRLDLFGSAAAGQDHPGKSDLDFLVEFLPLAPGRYADAYFDLLESLEELFGCRVDLVVASSIKNPYFREAVERTKTLLYAIQQAVVRISEFTQGKRFEDYQSEAMLRAAVERQFEIIGEALLATQIVRPSWAAR